MIIPARTCQLMVVAPRAHAHSIDCHHGTKQSSPCGSWHLVTACARASDGNMHECLQVLTTG